MTREELKTKLVQSLAQFLRSNPADISGMFLTLTQTVTEAASLAKAVVAEQQQIVDNSDKKDRS